MLELYQNIKACRIERGWSQTELANKVGYKDRSMISHIERGDVDLNQSQILAFSKIFGVSPGYLMGSDDDIHLSMEERKLVDAYRHLPEERKLAIRIMLDIEPSASKEKSSSPKRTNHSFSRDIQHRN